MSIRNNLPLSHSEDNMIRKVLCPLFFSLFVFILFGCQATISRLKPPLEEEGEIFLYIEPLPQEAERLRFTIEAIFAVGADGKEIPLSSFLKEIKLEDLKRQRLLASERLLEGSYTGFSFKIKKAILKTEYGEVDLLIPEKPVRMDFPFQVRRKRTSVISLEFRYRESIKNGFAFSPVFSIFIPARPISSLKGFVSNFGSNNIMVFDKKLKKIVSVIPTGKGSAGMVINERLGRLYVAISGDDAIELIDIMAEEIIDRIRLRTGDQPWELSLTPDGKLLLVVNKGSNTVSFIDSISMLEVGRVEVGRGPNSILIDNRGRRAFVFNTFSATISVIDIANKAVIATLSSDPGPLRGGFNRRGDKLYVIHEWSSYLTVYDPQSLSLLGRYGVRMGLSTIKVDTRTDLLYLGRMTDISVDVYDPGSFVPIDSIKTMGGISYMTIDGDENNLYMINPEKKSLMISSLVRKRIISEMDIGEEPYFVTMIGER